MVDFITHKELVELLDYDAPTGVFCWKVKRWRKNPGDVAGYFSKGYCYIKIEQISYLAHRLAWFYVTKRWPSLSIDHIDCNPSNNKFSNLREATQSQQNTNRPSNRGVRFYQNRWVAMIGFEGKQKYLGRFKTREEALAARVEAEKKFYGSYAYGAKE